MPSVSVVNGRAIVIEQLSAPQRVARFFLAPFTQTWHHRDLVEAILRRELQERFKGSVAGWVWAVIAPLMMLGVYAFAFTTTTKLPIEVSGSRLGYALFIFSGIIVFNFFSEVAFRAPMLLHEYSHFIKQTIFPSHMLAIISTLRATAYSGIALIVMMLFQVLTGHGLPWTCLLLPLILVPYLMFLMGLAWILSAIGAFTRDAGYLMMTIVPLFMFITPIFFSHTQLPEPLDFWIYANGLTGFAEVTRDLNMLGKIPSLAVYAWTMFVSIFTFYLGYWFFDRYRNVIVDVI